MLPWRSAPHSSQGKLNLIINKNIKINKARQLCNNLVLSLELQCNETILRGLMVLNNQIDLP